MHKFRIPWANLEDDGCFTCEAIDYKAALVQAIIEGICSLDWTEVWKDCGDHWEIWDLTTEGKRVVQKAY